jgi:transposase
VLRQKWSRGQIEARLANMPACLIGMEACVGAHHLSRKLGTLGHDARLMPAKYVRPYSKGQKNDFAAWLGLVPKQISTGDRTILGKISKRGNFDRLPGVMILELCRAQAPHP